MEKTEDFKMEILSSADEVVAEFVKDLKLLNSLKQKVKTSEVIPSASLSYSQLFRLKEQLTQMLSGFN